MSQQQEYKPMLDQDEEDEESSLRAIRASRPAKRRVERLRLILELGLVLLTLILCLILFNPSRLSRDLSVAPGPHPKSAFVFFTQIAHTVIDFDSPLEKCCFHARLEVCIR